MSHAHLGLILLVTLAVAGLGWAVVSSAPNTDRAAWPAGFRSNGERIYFTGTSGSGRPVIPRGGNRHMTMMGSGCVTCHGADREGGRLMPTVWQVAPPLTAEELFGAQGEDGHGEHESYTEASLRRAITEGIDPAGRRLDGAMPRWSMSAADLDDLIAFLKGPSDVAP